MCKISVSYKIDDLERISKSDSDFEFLCDEMASVDPNEVLDGDEISFLLPSGSEYVFVVKKEVKSINLKLKE